MRPHLTIAIFAALVGSTAAWTPGVYTSPMPSKEFTVNTQSRNDVLSFWHGIYQASEGYEDRIGWTGSLDAINHDTGTGSTSEVFVRDVERRLNFFRALSGSYADASLNSGSSVMVVDADLYKPDLLPPPVSSLPAKAAANQRSAYMMARAYMVNDELDGASHNPPADVIAWNKTAWNANNHSNLTIGYFGPGAVNAYMQENDASTSGSDNSAVRHRRWILFQSASDYATGDTPGAYVPAGATDHLKWRMPTNSLYVWQKPEELKQVAPRFSTYPCAGYFPAPLNSKHWSIHHPNANFANATVQMRNSSGNLMGTTKNVAASTGGPGDSTITWQVAGSAAATSFAQDTTYSITINGITGNGVPSQFQYTVTLIDPNILTSDQSLTGSATVPSTGDANYFFTPPPFAEAIEANVFSNSTAAWTETAEGNGSPTVVNNTSALYNFRSGAIAGFNPLAGGFSYRLTHPVRVDIMAKGVPEQSFELTREILASAGTPKLTFKYRRGYMTPASTLAVEYTQDNGATWTAFGTPLVGLTAAGTISDPGVLNWEGTFPISAHPYRVRFRYYRNSTSAVWIHQENPGVATGIFIDDITTSGCSWLDLKKTNTLAGNADRFTLNAASAGLMNTIPNGTEYQVRMRTKLGNRWFAYGPSKIVTATNNPVAGFNGWTTYEYPTLTGGFSGDHDGDGLSNAIEYGFILDPLAPSVSKDILNVNASLVKDVAGPYLSITRAANGVRDGVGAEWSETLADGSWSSEGVTVSYSSENNTATATAPAGTGKRFLRWKITTP